MRVFAADSDEDTLGSSGARLLQRREDMRALPSDIAVMRCCTTSITSWAKASRVQTFLATTGTSSGLQCHLRRFSSSSGGGWLRRVLSSGEDEDDDEEQEVVEDVDKEDEEEEDENDEEEEGEWRAYCACDSCGTWCRHVPQMLRHIRWRYER